MIWDTFGLFEALLADFGAALREADGLAQGEGQTEGVRLAMVGFRRYRPLGDWDHEATEWLAGRLQGDWSAWHSDCGPAVAVFACLAWGALLGKFRAREIDDAGFLLADAHLPAFDLMHRQDMRATYEAARGEPGSPALA